MKDNKGQALIEFVLILPVIIMLFFGIIDLGRIILENNRLEGLTSMVIDEYKDDDVIDLEAYLSNNGYKNVRVDVVKGNNNITVITLRKDVELITPGINRILDNPYEVKVERTINDE